MSRRRVFERVRRVAECIAFWAAPPAPVIVGFDSFEPGCEIHAYCGAIERVLDGQHVILIPAVDDDGRRCIHTFAGNPRDANAEFAHHEDTRVRALHAAVSVHNFRQDLERRGLLQ